MSILWKGFMRLKFFFESKLLLVLMIGYRGLLRVKMVLKSLVLLSCSVLCEMLVSFPLPLFFSNSKRLSVIVVNFAAYALMSFAVYKNDIRLCTQYVTQPENYLLIFFFLFLF